MSLGPRMILGAYTIERLLGRGGMGEVWLATQSGLDRNVALKVLSPALADDPGFRKRFIAESRLAASLDHPHIVPIHEAGEVDGRLFIAMRYVEGEDLGAILKREGRVAPDRALHLLRGIGEALDAAHDRGLVHRDVKPGNILVARTKRGEHAYLADFGLVKQLGSDAGLTRSGQLAGSVDYVAPEQIEGRAIDGRVDVYSLASVLYAALVGQPPYPRDSEVATLWAHVQAPPPRPSSEDPALAPFDDVVARGMAKDPADRYATAGELMTAADAAFALPSVASAPRSAPSAPTVSSGRRRGRLLWPMVATLAGGATLAAVVALALGSRGGFGGSSPSPGGGPGGSGAAIGSLPSTNPALPAFGRIAFVRRTILFPDVDQTCAAPGASNIWIARDDGTGAAPLTSDLMADNGRPQLSPDGSVVAFARSTEPGGAGELTLVPSIGGASRTLVADPTRTLQGTPQWSPDGSRIAYVGFDSRGTRDNALVIVDVAAGTVREFPVSPQASGRIAPRPRPSGIDLADTSAPPGTDGSSKADLMAVDWFPDGRLAALIRHGRVSDSEFGPVSFEVRRMTSEGLDLGPIRALGVADMSQLELSPDGTKLLFDSTGPTGSGDVDVYVAAVDGSSLIRLTTETGPDRDAAWSSDGQSIVFASERDGSLDLYVMGADGANVRQLTSGASRVAYCSPSWSTASAPIAEAKPSPRGDADDPRSFEIGELAAGTYHAAPFDPDFRITLPTGWEAWNIVPDALYLIRSDTRNVRIQANRVQVVYDGPCIDSPTKTIGPTAVDFINWLKSHEALAVSNIQPIGTGGVTGLRAHAVLTKVAGARCSILANKWALFPMSVDQFALSKGDEAAFYVLDIRGTRIVVTAFGPRAELERAAIEIDAILRSIVIP